MALQKWARHDRRLTDQRLLELGRFGDDVHALLLQEFAINAIDEDHVDDARLQGLGLHALIAHRLQQDLIALRVDAEMLEPEHRYDPSTASDAVDRELLAAQIFRSF